MSDERVSLDLLGSRVLTMTAELRDLQLRFGALEQRLGALENRFGALEIALVLWNRASAFKRNMTAMLALLVRVAERIEGGTA